MFLEIVQLISKETDWEPKVVLENVYTKRFITDRQGNYRYFSSIRAAVDWVRETDPSAVIKVRVGAIL